MKLSFVFPCLNEAESLQFCIDELKSSLDTLSVDYEIILSDNGSKDKSIEIAEKNALRIVHASEMGYGHALKKGIEESRGDYVMFADADGSYPLKDAAVLYKKAVEDNADMTIASRMKGTIEPGAMPFLHRFLGTPVLTMLINCFFKGKLSDCNSGFRCIRKTAYESWQIRSGGMEFASELLIKALKSNAKIVEIRSGLRRDRRSKEPHLRTWRDGMRHLLFILSERPQLMERCGFSILLLSTIMQILALASGPVSISGANIFDYHSHALLLLVACLACQVYLMSCYIYVNSDEKALSISRYLLDMDEAVLFVLLIVSFLVAMLSIVTVFVIWGLEDFAKVGAINHFLVILHMVSVCGFMSIGLLGIHILKKTR